MLGMSSVVLAVDEDEDEDEIDVDDVERRTCFTAYVPRLMLVRELMAISSGGGCIMYDATPCVLY